MKWLVVDGELVLWLWGDVAVEGLGWGYFADYGGVVGGRCVAINLIR